MYIQITPLAERKLLADLKDQPGTFKLFYDTEGCGCDGILIVNQAEAGDTTIKNVQSSF